MNRFEIITGHGGLSTDDAIAFAISATEREADFGVTITPGRGYCAPWEAEDVLTIVHYGPSARAVARYVSTLRLAFEQDAIAVAQSAADFRFHSVAHEYADGIREATS